jgi:polyisoprenoid-binding protein YceI
MTCEIDPAHSSVQLSVRHMGLSNVRGEFSTISGTGDTHR